ncbi:MAG: efflux transporter outer membrane subunit [Syntrophobacteraceae bacterium]|nr:efflux transporter outer membrane subunit [Syntrophobacteraceae bacterium]
MTLKKYVLSPISLAALFLSLQGCLKVGPDFVKPAAPVATNWLETGNKQVKNKPANYRAWWKSFEDPDLNRIIDRAYRDNVTLQIAAVNVLQARAELGIAVGGLFPQTQQLTGSTTFNRFSSYSAVGSAGTTASANPSIKNTYRQDNTGANVAWELDFWGKYRRGVASADASWRASLADYDTALVSLTANAANAYIRIRTLERQIQIARENVTTQRESLRIAQARFHAGSTSQRDVEQAKTILYNTLSTIPVLEQQLKQNKDALSVLLGIPPNNLSNLLGGSYQIPVPPPSIAVGIPADLLRRRPDVRSAELKALAQCQQIGIAKAELYPAFSLTGSFGFSATDYASAKLSDLLTAKAASISAGPSVQWNIFNYGQITNNVRAQDAQFQALLLTYKNTVLSAQQEVEDYLTGFMRSQENARSLALAAAAAKRSLALAFIQYRNGSTDFTTVLTAHQALLTAQDSLATALGNIALNLVGVYKSLGGGWEIRQGKDILPPEIKEMMAKRTNWGDLLCPAAYLPPPCKQPDIRCPDW